MNDLQIDWLRAFVSTVDGGSLSVAAQVVHRSQAAVSMQIKKLEQTVGAPVLIRDARHLSLTAAGQQLLPFARRILAAHQEAQTALRGPNISGRVRLGIPEDYAVAYLVPVLRTFSGLYPDVEVTLVCAQSTALLPQISAGEIDVAIVSQDRPSRGVVLFREPLVWVGSRAVEVWRRDPLPVAIYEEGAVVRTMTQAALTVHGRRFRLAYHSPSLTGQIAATESGLAVAVLTRCSVPSSLQMLDAKHGLPALSAVPVAVVMSRAAKRLQPARSLEQLIITTLSH